jgi:hypothetical protein
MSLFSTKYLFIHNNRTSRDYIRLRAAVREGAQKLPKRDWLEYRANAGDNKGVLKSLNGAEERARYLLKHRPIGTTVQIEAVKDKKEVVDRVKYRKTKDTPDVKPTPGNLYLDRVEGYIEEAFPRARWAGDCVCKPNSDHAFCRAVDYFDSSENMVKMRNALLAEADYFNIEYIILFDRIWYRNGGSAHYSGVYHAHIHVSVGGQGVSACH